MKALTEGIFANRKWDRTGYGGPINPQFPTPVGPNIGAQPNSPNLFTSPNLEVDQCANLYGWQMQLVGMLNQPNKDIYILSQPGSGKTAPVICHWVNNVLGISTSQPPNEQHLLRFITKPQNIPQVLWLVPIRNLGVNIEEEMTERFASIILQILNRAGGTIPNPVDGNLINLIFNNPNLDINVIIKALGNFGGGKSRDLLLGILALNHNQVPSDKIPEFKTVLGQLVKSFIENALVGRIQEGLNSTKLDSGKLKPFVISIYESSKHVIKDMDKLRLIIFDEAQRIQGGEEPDDQRAAQIGDSIHKVLFHENGRNAQIAMLSGSTSKATASNIVHYFNVTYKRRFDTGPYQTPENVTNPADIRVFPMANLDDKFTQLRIIQTALAGGNLRKGGIVFVIFGKNKINQLIDQIAPTEAGYIHPGKKLSTTRGAIYSKSDVSQVTKPGDINDIKDDRLRRAASHGLGYLYRPEELTPDRERDTTIVQNLFRAGVIRVLFATDAVREGMNITCKEMYIPTIINPSNGKEMEAGSLAQLINRAGRKEGTYATIYTDSKFVGDITYALSKDSDRFGSQPFMLPGSTYSKIEAGLNYGVNIPIDAAKDLYKSFRRAFNNP